MHDKHEKCIQKKVNYFLNSSISIKWDSCNLIYILNKSKLNTKMDTNKRILKNVLNSDYRYLVMSKIK